MYSTEKELALLGGKPLIAEKFKRYNSIGEEELSAVTKVLESGILSEYVGSLGDKFMGGTYVRRLETFAARKFGANFAIAVNSWTSGLICAISSLNFPRESEVITTSWTMAATATAVLHANLNPVFVDIDEKSFNIDPKAIERAITSKTKAIIAPDIFGQSARISDLRKICDENELILISDSAQAPGARYGEKFAGTLADIGGISLNHHKHINCGEGGLIFTNDENLYQKMLLIRNHGEVVAERGAFSKLDSAWIRGYNFRMGEIEAAISLEQIKKLDGLVAGRQKVAQQITSYLEEFQDYLSLPYVEPENTHVYYVYGIKIKSTLQISNDIFYEALSAEGIQGISNGYQNIHELPIFKKYKNDGVKVSKDLHRNKFIGLNLCAFEYELSEIELVSQAIKKVFHNKDKLRKNK